MTRGGEEEGTVRPTGWRLPAAIILFTGVIGYAVADIAYPRLPVLPWSAIPTLVLLALAEAYTAGRTRRRIRREPGTEPIMPLSAARLVALAKASAVFGSMVVGFFAGFALALADRWDIPGPRADTLTSLGTLLAGALLLGAALLLEQACRVPDDEEPGAGAGPGADG